MQQNLVIAIVVIAIVLVAGALYLQGGVNMPPYTTSTTTTTATETQTQATSTATTSVTSTGQLREFTIHESSFAFDVTTITVNKGDTVKITAISDDIGHNICVEEYGLCTQTVSSGLSATISFTADKAGNFTYYCAIDGHRGFGMVGQLIVKE